MKLKMGCEFFFKLGGLKHTYKQFNNSAFLSLIDESIDYYKLHFPQLKMKNQNSNQINEPYTIYLYWDKPSLRFN